VVSVHGETGLERETGSAGHGRTVVLKLAVQDSGIGLTQAAREKLFQPFSQADSSTTRRYGGTGLGLSICKRLGETMGGEIGVDSAPGEGASFWVRVPLEVAEEKRAGMRPLEALSGKLVLMAGGEVNSRDIRCTYFDAWQMHCEVVPGLAELHGRLAALENDGLIPDALVLAHPLSDASIMEAVASLQAHCKHPRLICCLSQADRQMKAELISHGVIVTQQPIKQSVLFNALVTPLPTGQVTPKRRISDAVDHLHGAQVLADKHRLLLAEDNPVNQRVAVHMLNKLGYAVDVVDNGSLALLALARESYDLVLMDCQMPEMDGFDATAAIRRTEANTSKHLPIVAMTANALQGDREQCLAAGMDDYIAKPIETPQLASLLAKWLPKAGATTQAKPTIEPVPVVAQNASTEGESPNDTRSPAIDMQRLTEMFGEDDAVINELLEVYEHSLGPLCERLKREVRDRGQQLKGLAHELRGASANVGALALADLAGQLEKLSPGRNWVEIEALVTRIDEESTRTIEFIFRRTGRT
jgi:CheY-like chemotaxis protein/HPt (histidine-containing phosphotransfer) domain-containing protein